MDGWIDRLAHRCRDCQLANIGIAELVERSRLSMTRLLKHMLERCSCSSMQGPNMIKGEYPTAFPLKHQHKDLRLALELADTGTLAELPLAKLTEAIYRQGARSLDPPRLTATTHSSSLLAVGRLLCGLANCLPPFCATRPPRQPELALADAMCLAAGVEEGFGDMDFSAVMEVKHPPAET